MKFLKATLVAMTAVALIAGAAYAQNEVLGLVSPPTAVDFTPLFGQVVQSVMLIVMLGVTWLVNKYVKDANTRATLLAAAQNAAKFGVNKIEGAVPGSVLTVNLGSAVAAEAVKYLQAVVPDALAHFGLDGEALAKFVWAHLPPVDGTVSDSTFTQIAAAASGSPSASTAPAPTASDIVAALAPALEAAVDALAAKYLKGNAPVTIPAAPAPAAPSTAATK